MLSGKTAWITGGGSGIGRAAAEALAQAGAQVIISGRRPELLSKAVGRIVAAGGSAEAEAIDVSDPLAVMETAKRLNERHGCIDILVNSAGFNVPQRQWNDMDNALWDQVIEINLNATRYCIAAVLPAMRAKKGGLVINVAAWAGRFVVGRAGAAYTAAKHGVVALTMSLNMEECHSGIRATALCPGEVDTPMHQSRPQAPSAQEARGMLQAEDMGRIILFLAETPPHVCFNEILVAPTLNRALLGATKSGMVA